jgi:hypothetical protein
MQKDSLIFKILEKEIKDTLVEDPDYVIYTQLDLLAGAILPQSVERTIDIILHEVINHFVGNSVDEEIKEYGWD